MLTLSLLRHGKSSWDNPDQDDFERPLAQRGLKAAPMMGKKLAALKPVLDLALCSTAVRTRQTLELVLAELSSPTLEVHYDDALYHALPEHLLDIVIKYASAQHPTSPQHILVVGHNPGLQALALALAGDGDPDAIHALANKFPTAALAELTFDVQAWSDITPGTGIPGTGHLKLFTTPDSPT